MLPIPVMIARLCLIGAESVAFRVGDGLHYGGAVDELQQDASGTATATLDGHTIRRKIAYRPLLSDKGLVYRRLIVFVFSSPSFSVYTQSTGRGGCTLTEAAGRMDWL